MTNDTYGYYTGIKRDWSKYSKPIYEFDLIENYKTALDVIIFKDFFILLFEYGEFSYFRIQEENGERRID
jgi:hypothetical protein